MKALGGRSAGSRGRRRIVALAVVGALVVGAVALAATASAGKKARACMPKDPTAKNVIVMISDGCGYNHILATDFYQYGKTGKQVYQKFPVRVGMSTYSVFGSYDPKLAWKSFDYVRSNATDSASAGTAMSTGFKTYDAAIGVDVNKQTLYNVSQRAEALGKSTGVVTSVQWSHATPAAYVAHNESRNNYSQLAQEMIDDSMTDVIMGAGHPHFDNNGKPAANSYKYVGDQVTWDALKAGTAGGDADGDGIADPWTLIETEADFAALTVGATPKRVCGTAQVHSTLQQSRGGDDKADPYDVPLNTNVPDLVTMTKGALNVLDDNADGFVLMVEGGAVDWAGHGNQSGRLIEEEIDFNRSVEAVCKWIEKNSSWDETLLVVTGDHETGYLTGPGSDPRWKPIVNKGKGNVPGMQWNSGDHTNSLIPLFAKGVGAKQLRKEADQNDYRHGRYMDNTELAKVVFELLK